MNTGQEAEDCYSMLYDVPGAGASKREMICHITGPGPSVNVLDVPAVVDRLINGGICRVCFC